jgi:hypothetical protein
VKLDLAFWPFYFSRSPPQLFSRRKQNHSRAAGAKFFEKTHAETLKRAGNQQSRSESVTAKTKQNFAWCKAGEGVPKAKRTQARENARSSRLRTKNTNRSRSSC